MLHRSLYCHLLSERSRSPCGERGLKYAEAVKLPSQGMYRDGRCCIFGVIPYLTRRLAEGMRFNIQKNAMTEIALFYCTNPL